MKAAIMGYGTIGSGVYEVLDKNCKSVEKKAGEPIEVKYILDLREFPGTPFRASGTKLSVPSGGAVYGIGSCVGYGFLDPVFCHGKQEIPTGVG